MTFNLYAFVWVVAVAALIVLSAWLDRRRNPPVPKRAAIQRKNK